MPPLTRLASQYMHAEKQEIIKDLRGYKSADIPASLKLTDSEPAMTSVGCTLGSNGIETARHR